LSSAYIEQEDSFISPASI